MLLKLEMYERVVGGATKIWYASIGELVEEEVVGAFGWLVGEHPLIIGGCCSIFGHLCWLA